MLARMDLDTQRQFYAEEIRAVANLQSEVLVQAFAKVPREYFLGPGPWQIVVPSEPGSFSYRTTDDADPRHLYHNVLVAIDAERRLNNGQPSGLALWSDALDLQKGDRVVHIGCATGYYTAILAEVILGQCGLTLCDLEGGFLCRLPSQRIPSAVEEGLF